MSTLKNILAVVERKIEELRALDAYVGDLLPKMQLAAQVFMANPNHPNLVVLKDLVGMYSKTFAKWAPNLDRIQAYKKQGIGAGHPKYIEADFFRQSPPRLSLLAESMMKARQKGNLKQFEGDRKQMVQILQEMARRGRPD